VKCELILKISSQSVYNFLPRLVALAIQRLGRKNFRALGLRLIVGRGGFNPLKTFP